MWPELALLTGTLKNHWPENPTGLSLVRLVKLLCRRARQVTSGSGVLDVTCHNPSNSIWSYAVAAKATHFAAFMMIVATACGCETYTA